MKYLITALVIISAQITSAQVYLESSGRCNTYVKAFDGTHTKQNSEEPDATTCELAYATALDKAIRSSWTCEATYRSNPDDEKCLVFTTCRRTTCE